MLWLRLLVCGAVFVAPVAFAAPHYFLEPSEQYGLLPLSGDPEVKAEYYGELAGYPNLYDVSVGTPFLLTLELVQPHTSTPIPYSLTVIEVIEEGQVREVASLRTADMADAWRSEYSYVLGITRLSGAKYAAELPPGRYQIEVNTPDNLGRYALIVGHRDEGAGYFATWRRVLFANTFFGNYLQFWFASVFVLPHFIAVALALSWWRRRKRRRMYA